MDFLPWGRLAVNQLPGGVLSMKSKTTKGTSAYKHTHNVNMYTLGNKLSCNGYVYYGWLTGCVDRTVIDIDVLSYSGSTDTE